MKDLLWLVPLFPLAGFLINGVVYLLAQPAAADRLRHVRTASSRRAESAKGPAHPHAHMHGQTHPRFQRLHYAGGDGPRRRSRALFAFGAIFDVGLSQPLARARPTS